MQKELIKKTREIGHFGTDKVVVLLNRGYPIYNLRDKVERFIRYCVPCMLINKQEDFLHTIDKGNLPLATWHIDFLGSLTNTPRGYKHIFSVIDAFIKFCWLFPIKIHQQKLLIK